MEINIIFIILKYALFNFKLTFEFIGLPSQLRDAVLAEFEGKSTATQSEVNRDHQMQQQIVALSNGEDMWATRDNPNERLLRMARTVIHDREQSRIKLPPPPTTSTAHILNNTAEPPVTDKLKRSHSHAFNSHDDDPEDHLLLPPGITSIEELQRFNLPQRVQMKVDNSTVGIESGTGINNSSVSSGSSRSIDTMSVLTIKTTTSSSRTHDVYHSNDMDSAVSVKPKPPKPSGPPPASAFKHSASLTTAAVVTTLR